MATVLSCRSVRCPTWLPGRAATTTWRSAIRPMAQEKVFREIAFDPARLDALVGYYALAPQGGVEFTKEDGQLWARPMGQARIPAFPYGERDFFAKAIAAQFSFDAPGPDGIVAG